MTTVAQYAIDFAPVTDAAVKVAAIVISGALTYYGPRFINAFAARTGIRIDEANQMALIQAVDTGAGVIETKLDQKLMDLSHVNINNEHVSKQANFAIAKLGQTAADMGLTVPMVANMIVGAVDTGSRVPTTTLTDTTTMGSLAAPAGIDKSSSTSTTWPGVAADKSPAALS